MLCNHTVEDFVYDFFCTWGWSGWLKGVVKIIKTEHKKCSCVWGIETISCKYYQRMLFGKKVLFLAPLAENCTCHTCLLVWRGYCCGLSASLTIVLIIYPVLKFSHHIAAVSINHMDPVNVGRMTMYSAADISLSLKPRITLRTPCLDHCSSRVAVLNWQLSQKRAAKWWLPTHCS